MIKLFNKNLKKLNTSLQKTLDIGADKDINKRQNYHDTNNIPKKEQYYIFEQDFVFEK